MRYLWRAVGRSVGLTLMTLGLVLSPGLYAVLEVLDHQRDGAIADYRLQQLPASTYANELKAALDAGDGDLARSLLALADDRKVAIPAALRQRVADLPAVDLGRAAQEGWNCVVNGDFDSEAGFACVVATDLTGVGDVRDLIGEGGNYLSGRPVNYFTLGVASVGLTLTVATVTSLGSALPLRAGASFLKAINKLGKLPPRLSREIGIALARSIDGKALGEAVRLGTALRFGEMGAPLARLFNPRAVEKVTTLATDFGRIGSVGGVRAMKLSAATATEVREVSLLARLAERYQGKYLAVVKLLGRGAVRLLDLVWTFAGWLLAAAGWLLSFALFAMRWSARTARVLWAAARLPFAIVARAHAVPLARVEPTLAG